MNNVKATKKQLAFLAVLLCTTANADESICPVNTEIPESIRINESDLTKEKAEAALKILGSIVSGEDSNHLPNAIPNAAKTIQGYVLKRNALENRSRIPGFDVSTF